MRGDDGGRSREARERAAEGEDGERDGRGGEDDGDAGRRGTRGKGADDEGRETEAIGDDDDARDELETIVEVVVGGVDVDAPDDDFDDRLELIPRVVVVPDRFRFPPFVVGAFSSRPASSRVSIVFPSSPIAFAVFALRRALARFPRSPPIVTSHPDVPVVALRVAVVDRVARPPSRIALASSRIAPPARARRVVPPIAPRASADASPPSSARGRVARASSRASSCADNVD